MYLPQAFEEVRPAVLSRLIEDNPLGALVTHGPSGLDANHMPFELIAAGAERAVLKAHVARANPVWQEVRQGEDVLVIFRAADAYVSPNWYPSKHESHRQVPTWNYQVVHVHGQIRVHDDESYVRGVVARLTRTHEARAEAGRAWRMGDAPPDYIDGLLKSIVGIEIEVSRIVGKFKLSQNKDERDRRGAAQELDRRGHVEIAKAMREL